MKDRQLIVEGGFMDEVYFLRHYLETIKYRFLKSINNCPDHFPDLDIGSGVRKPIEILAHMSFVIRCAQSVFDDIELDKGLMTWEEEVTQFNKELKKLEKYVTDGLPNRERIVEKLLQGPLSDVMTHVGQLSMLRRLAGDHLPAENFFEANIRIDEDQCK
jgi:hypothetical protein